VRCHHRAHDQHHHLLEAQLLLVCSSPRSMPLTIGASAVRTNPWHSMDLDLVRDEACPRPSHLQPIGHCMTPNPTPAGAA
jgi:hypothetical protein